MDPKSCKMSVAYPVSSMPMISMILHLALIEPDCLVTGVTTLGKARFETCCTKGLLFSKQQKRLEFFKKTFVLITL